MAYDTARYYDPNLGRFISADTIVPGAGSLTVSPNDPVAAGVWSQRGAAANPQRLNRYSYVLNNPVRNTDPTGHVTSDGRDDKGMGGTTGTGGGPGGRGGAKGGQGAEPITHEPLPDLRGKTMEADGSIHPTGEGTASEIAGATCGDCGTVKPDLVRGPGRVNIDSDGVSLRCRVCVHSGNVPSIPANKTAFIRSFNDYELENGNPRYTPEYGGGEPGHFSAFQGEPIGKADEVAPNIDTFIRNPATRQKP